MHTQKRPIALKIAALVYFLLTGVFASAQAPQGTAAAVPDHYIVQLRSGIDPEQTGRELAVQHGLALGPVYRYALNGFAAMIPSQRLAQLRADSRVLLVEPDLPVSAWAQTLPTGVNRIDADANSIAKINGIDERVGVDIAIIDTGIDLDHPDLNVFKATNCVSGVFTASCTDGQGDDGNGHGSHVAGTAAALDNGIGVVGVAPGARLWAVRVLDNNGSGRLSWIIAGIDWVTKNAAEIEVANMSLGGQGLSSSLRTAIQNSVAKGVVYVVAAGNSSQDVYGADHVFGTSDDFFPASYPEVATISALADSDGQPGGLGSATSYGPDDTLASFSNFSTNVVAGNPVISDGRAIDFTAPGVSILSTYKNGGYADGWSGTSMASPHGAGAAALYIAANGIPVTKDGLYVAQVRQALIDNAQLHQPQGKWGPGDTNDPDNNPEGLVYVVDNVNDPPTASFIFSCTGLTCNFNGSGSSDPDGTISSYVWNFGDATPTGSGATVSHTYTAASTYSVTLTVTDNDGATDDEVKSVTVSVATAMHIGDLDGSKTSQGNTWTATVTITVHDASHNLVSSATVSGGWSNGATDSASCTTNSSGQCTVNKSGIAKKVGSVTFSVPGVTHATLTYSSGDNHDPDPGDSTGTAIIVPKP